MVSFPRSTTAGSGGAAGHTRGDGAASRRSGGAETGELEVFSNHVGSKALQVVDAPTVAHRRLVEVGGKVTVIDGERLVRLELQP